MIEKDHTRNQTRRTSDKWWRANASAIAIVIGLVGQGIILVRYATNIENKQEAQDNRQDRFEVAVSEWQKTRAILPERIARMENALENMANTVNGLASEMREDRRAERKQNRDRQ